MLFNCGISKLDPFRIIEKVVGELPCAWALFMILKVDFDVNLVVIRFKIVFTGVTDFSHIFK